MNRKLFYPLVAALFLLTLWALDDIAQYWYARTTMGTVEAIEQRSKQIGTSFRYGFTTYTVIAWDEDGLDRRFGIPYQFNKNRSNRPYVGMKFPIVYVKSKPHLMRLASSHSGFRSLWIPLLLAWLFAWLEWRGKIHDSWYEPKSRRGVPIPENKSWRSEAWLKWHGKISRSWRGK
jgi:hypothetical protein